MNKDIPQLCIVVPCYNEEEALAATAQQLANLLSEMVAAGEVLRTSCICFVNDGSTDETWKGILWLMERSPVFRGINLSRNFGHQGALLAGLFTVQADAYVSIDADLQDDEQKIREMVRLYREGNDIVYGCRNDRHTDSWGKRTTAELFYKVRAWLGCRTIRDHADFRLMSRRAVDALRQYGEVNLYLRGIIPMLGFPSAKVYYARRARAQGDSKYPLSKMAKLAWDGVVNFSDVPLMACLGVGMLCFLVSIGLMVWALVQWYAGATLPGWTSLVLVVCFFSSFQFLFIGIIGLYIGKVLRETKRRPSFIVQDDLTRR